MKSIVHDLELSVRTTNVLNAMGTVQTYEDFMDLTEAEVRAQRGAGARTWREIREIQKNITMPPKGEIAALRDQAALAALPAIIQVCAGDGPREIGTETFEQMFARKAWAVADAFIAAREGKTDG